MQRQTNRTSKLAYSIKTIAWIAIVMFFYLLKIDLTYASEKITHFRVYERDRILTETIDLKSAIHIADQAWHRYVEEIPSREWKYAHLPRFVIEQQGSSKPEWIFDNLEQARKEFSKVNNSALVQLDKPGWFAHSYPRYALTTVTSKSNTKYFSRIEQAQAAFKQAKRSKFPSFVVDMSKRLLSAKHVFPSSKQKTYQVQLIDSDTPIAEGYSLEKALQLCLSTPQTKVVETQTAKMIFTHQNDFEVYSINELERRGFYSADEAIAYAKKRPLRVVEWRGQTIWHQEPTYAIVNRDDLDSSPKARYFNLDQARKKATELGDTVVLAEDGIPLWQAKRALQVWAWNGSSSTEMIQSQLAPVIGLDVTSPTWFVLKNAAGDLEDKSDPALVAWAHARGIEVHPLIHNQFDSGLTNKFLANKKATDKWIKSVISRAVELGVNGLNLDFESLKGSDRQAFSAFATQFANACRAANLTVSIDLPRGDERWDHKTAFDRTVLAKAFDYIILMGYDEHYRGSLTAGPVASFAWVEKGIVNFLESGIRREQLILGIPFYSRMWQVNALSLPQKDASGNPISKSIFMKDIPDLIQNETATIETKESDSGQSRIRFEKDGGTYVLWNEDIQTIQKRFEMVKQFDLGGIAAWRLGYEPTELWPNLVQWK